MNYNIIIENKNIEPLPLKLIKYCNKNDKIRFKCIYLIHYNLCNNPNWSSLLTDTKRSIIENIEKSIYNNSIKKSLENNELPTKNSRYFLLIYSQISNDIIIALNYDKYPYISNDIIYDKINIKDIGNININELIKSSLNYKQKICINNVEKIEIKKSTIYKCKKCKSNEIIKERKQDRSGDEGYTMYFNCNYCNYSWKIKG